MNSKKAKGGLSFGVKYIWVKSSLSLTKRTRQFISLSQLNGLYIGNNTSGFMMLLEKYLAECGTYGKCQRNGRGYCFPIVVTAISIIVVVVTVWRI